jgi:Cu/Ag efflux pump CusA
MCGIPTSIWVVLITIAILVAVVFKMKGLFKKFLPEPDESNSFLVYLIICGVMLFASVEVMQTLGKNSENIAAFFGSIRHQCEPPKDERSTEQFIQEELDKIKRQP